MAFISPKVNTPSSETCVKLQSLAIWVFKNSKGKFYKSFEINSKISKLRVWHYCSHWMRLAWSRHQHFTTGHRTYAGVLSEISAFLAAELSFTKPFLVFMLCTFSMAQKYFDFFHERGKKSVANIAMASRF